MRDGTPASDRATNAETVSPSPGRAGEGRGEGGCLFLILLFLFLLILILIPPPLILDPDSLPRFVCFGYFVVDSGIQNFPKHAYAGLRGNIRQYPADGRFPNRLFPPKQPHNPTSNRLIPNIGTTMQPTR